MNWLMMDYKNILTEYVKPEKINFLRTVFTQNMTAPVFIGSENGCKTANIFCTYKTARKSDLNIVYNIKNKIQNRLSFLCRYVANHAALRQFRLKKNKQCFSGNFFEKQMRQAGFYFYFLFPKKQMRPFFLNFYLIKTQ